MMKPVKQVHSLAAAVLLALCVPGQPAQASHRVMLFNQMAMDEILDMWPDFVDSVNNQARGIEDPGGRGIIVQSPLRAHLNQLLREQPTPAQYGEGFKMLIRRSYHPAGITTFGSRLNTNEQVTAYEYLLREEGRLPVRFAFSFDLARQPIPAAAASGLYENIGVQWQTIEYNPWLWMHGMSSEGDWDAPNRGCMGDDLPARAGVDRKQVKEVLEICPDFSSPTVQALIRGLRSGWRWAGVHAVGSNAIRIFVQKLEEAMRRNPGVMTLEYVRGERNGFAHGTLTGAVPDVVAALKKYNLYLPINVWRSLAIEPQNIRQNYGEPGWAFLAPVKTLIDQGVKVVGEGHGELNPGNYFTNFHIYVNRTLSPGNGNSRPPPEPGEKGETFLPEEGIDRVQALKLFTRRSAEFLYADARVGTIEPGKYADFVVADKDYLSGPDSEIKDNKVIMTVQADEIVYRDPAYRPDIRPAATAASRD